MGSSVDRGLDHTLACGASANNSKHPPVRHGERGDRDCRVSFASRVRMDALLEAPCRELARTGSEEAQVSPDPLRRDVFRRSRPDEHPMKGQFYRVLP
jgi:hypothetical protein